MKLITETLPERSRREQIKDEGFGGSAGMTTKLVLLGEYVKVVGGYAFKSEDFTDEGIPVIRISDVQNGTVCIDKAVRIPKTHVGKGENYCIKPGDILIAMSGATTGKIGVVPNNFDSLILQNQRVGNFRVTDPEQIDKVYLKHFVSSPSYQNQIWNSMVGVAQPNISSKQLENFEIDLPPLEEQRRIAEILDHAEKLRSKRREAIAQLDTLTQAIFIEMFGDPVFNPQKWRRVELVNMCSSANDIKCGPFGTQLSKDEYIAEGIPLWGIKNVNALFKIPTHEFLEAQTAKKLIQYSIEPGDIVMTRKGTVGNCAVYPDSYPLGIMHSDLLRLRVNRQKCDPMFLSHQLHYSRDVERQLTLISGGAIMPGINVTKLKSLEVLVPPLVLQQEFAHRVEAVEKLKASHRASLSELDTLFASLQNRAFRGEL